MLRHGHGKYTWPNAIVYNGEWKNDNQDGKGQLEIPVQYKIVNGIGGVSDWVG